MRKLVFSMLMAMSLSYVFSENTIDLHSLTSSSPPSELTIQSHLGVGFFGELAKVVNGILHFENENLQKIHVDWSQEFFPYKDDPFSNGWDLFFEPIQVCTNPLDVAESRKIVAGGNYHHIHDFHCIDQWINYESHLNYRLDMHRVINKYIKLNDEILDKKSVFFGNHMSGFYCIGVHIRYGADHGAEAPAGIPTLNDYIDEVKSLLKSQNSNRTRIYLATDSHYVVDQFKKEFPHILLHISAFRTKYRDEPHLIYGQADYWQAHRDEWHKAKPGYYGGETVLLDVLLLSECNIFIHSSSNVADFVTYFNPYIQSIYLPKNTKTWPCRHNL